MAGGGNELRGGFRVRGASGVSEGHRALADLGSEGRE